MSQPSQEVLFYGRCQLEALLVENEMRKRKGEAPAYGEEVFRSLAEEIRGDFRKAMEYDTP